MSTVLLLLLPLFCAHIRIFFFLQEKSTGTRWQPATHWAESAVHTGTYNHRDDTEGKPLEQWSRNPGLLAHLKVRIEALRRAIPHLLRSAGRCPTVAQTIGAG